MLRQEQELSICGWKAGHFFIKTNEPPVHPELPVDPSTGIGAQGSRKVNILYLIHRQYLIKQNTLSILPVPHALLLVYLHHSYLSEPPPVANDNCNSNSLPYHTHRHQELPLCLLRQSQGACKSL